MGPTAYNAWRITTLTALPGWALGLALAALGLALWLSFRGVRSEPSTRRRRILQGLRALAALLVFGLLLEPGLELRAESRVRARIALLLDTSRSMRFPAAPPSSGPAPSRMEELLRWLRSKSPELLQLASRFQIDVYGFDKELQPQDPARLVAALDTPGGPAAVNQAAAALAQGNATDLLGAVTSAGQSGSGGRPLAGVILASDGADNAELEGGVGKPAAAELQRLGAPIFALPIGGQAQKDLSIDNVLVDDFAFVRNQVTVDVKISARGFGSTSVPLTLKREGQVIAQRQVALQGDGETSAKLTFVPDRTGKFAFNLSVPVYEGEALAQNNSRSFVLKVIRDRVRVLLVVGRPSWDVRFLRQLLKKDPNVDLISFFILRTPGDDTHSSQEELSLIPFPTQEIFQEQLRTFDLVIFQDFNHRPYHMSAYLDGIASYVREGGAFAMIGGDQSFSAGDYSGTAIEEILPAQLVPQGAPPIDETPAQVQLTEAGRRHPVTELLPGQAANEALWARLPKLPGLNIIGPPRGNGQVLLAATDGRPVLVVGDAGTGRSLALTTDASWQWSFLAAGQELGPRAYETFWHGAIRWLVRDPSLTPMRLAAERPSFEPGEAPALDAQVRGSDYGAAAGAQLTVVLVSGEDGKQRPIAGPVAGPDGTARVQLPALPPGAYKATVIARRPDGAAVGEAEEAFVVAPTGAEQLKVAPRPDLLEALAKASGGRLIDAGDKLANLPYRDPERVEVGQRTTRPLWDTWTVLALLCTVVGLEWTLRRRWGYA